MKKIPLTALIIAKNEGHQIARALKSLQFCDEIIIILDDEATEQPTLQIAKQYNATPIIKYLPTEGQRRSYGQNIARNDWVLECDADEEITNELAQELTKLFQIPPTGVGYYQIKFDNFIGERRVRYGWGAYMGTDKKACLCHKNAKQWGEEEVHPKVSLHNKMGILQHYINHYIDRDLTDLFHRLNRYTSLNARDLLTKNNQDSLPKGMQKAIGRFFKCYVMKRGYKEGFYGFTIALCAALYPLVSMLKYWELRKK